MTTKIRKWGNSYAVRIPKEIIKKMNFREGSLISFSSQGDTVTFEHVKKPKYTLDELMKDFDKKTQHELIDWGPDAGSEIIEPWGK